MRIQLLMASAIIIFCHNTTSLGSIQYAPPTDRHGNRRDLSTVALVKGIRGWRGGVGLDGLTTAHAAKSTDSKCVTVVRYTERASRPSGVRAK